MKIIDIPSVIKWVSKYEAEYNEDTQILHLYKAIPVKEFMTLKRILNPYRFKLKDIIIEGK